jgi:hypothetical protein
MYEVEEERREGDRIRPLAEPLINDIIKAHAKTVPESQRAESHSQLSAFLEGCGADLVFEHISGLINPADCLSRHVREPPKLEVTKTGERDVRGLHIAVDRQG